MVLDRHPVSCNSGCNISFFDFIFKYLCHGISDCSFCPYKLGIILTLKSQENGKEISEKVPLLKQVNIEKNKKIELDDSLENLEGTKYQ